MSALGIAIAVWGFGGAISFLLRRSRQAAAVGALAAVVGSIAVVVAATSALTSGSAHVWTAAWTLPGGALSLRLDPLACVFLLPIGVVGGPCAVYGVAYLEHHGHHGRGFAAYNLLLASMALVATANDVLLLIIAWEWMTLTSWMLVVTDHDEPSVRAAGLQYLIAGHLATAALLLLVMVLASAAGTFAISEMGPGRAALPAGVLFLLALAGFGTKAGIVPAHVWLPDAHPAAPSHVSALMSAVMITMGFYGLARFIPLLGDPPIWWGCLLIGLGAVGAVGGIAFGLAQRDVKRTLAYSTVENAGIVTLAMGTGLVGSALHAPLVAGIAFTAALLHVWNHALAKALMFLGFGAVAQRVGSRQLDAMGGVLRRWRVVGAALVVGAAAIAALPGLNVFTSEWLLLRAQFAGAMTERGGPQVAMLAGVVALALSGGVAAACFTRLVGLGLLGSPRRAAAEAPAEPGWTMSVPILLLCAGCVAIALAPARVTALLADAVRSISPVADVAPIAGLLHPLALIPLVLIAFVALLLGARALARRAALERRSTTWGCGYPAPTARMQYSSTSYGEPVTNVLQPILHTNVRATATSWRSETPDRVLTGIYLPVIAAVDSASRWLRALASPRVNRSLLYVAATVLLLVTLLFLPAVGTPR